MLIARASGMMASPSLYKGAHMADSFHVTVEPVLI